MSPADDLDDELFDDVTRPLLVGYVRRDLLSSEDELAELETEMASFARKSGFSMGYTYVERSRSYAELEALVGFIQGCEDVAVIIPSPMHFLVAETPLDMRAVFERATGARVLRLDSP